MRVGLHCLRMTDLNAPPIVIAGAGIGGLTLGLALKQCGISFRIIERHPTLSEVGAGITLWSNALRVLDHLGAGDAVRRWGAPATTGVLGSANGAVLQRTSQGELESMGVRMFAFHRAELQRALFELLPPDSVTFGSGVEGFDDEGDSVKVRLGNGEVLTTPLLVGADGLRSRSRIQVLGESPLRYAGYACYRAISPIPANWGGVCGEFMGAGDRFGVVAIPGDRLYWYAVVAQASGTPCPLDPKSELRRRFGSYAFDVPAIIQGTRSEDLIYHELFDRIPVAKWSKGRVVVLGDAAHPTTPNLGQGAAMAMESALILARLLNESPGDVAAALRRFERTRYLRTRTVTETSRTVGRLAQVRNPVLSALRNFLFAHMPASVRRRQLESLVNYDAGTCSLAT